MMRFHSDKGGKEAVRFFGVSLSGLVIDIGAAWALIAFAGAPDLIAAVVGFSIATVTNYFGHQFWTFSGTERRASLRRFMAFAGVVLFTLAVRLLTLSFLAPLLPGSGLNAPIRLGLAATVSFFVSYLMSKFLVFRQKAKSRV